MSDERTVFGRQYVASVRPVTEREHKITIYNQRTGKVYRRFTYEGQGSRYYAQKLIEEYEGVRNGHN